MIRSFADARTAALFQGLAAKGFPADLRRRAKMKLDLLHAATTLDFLRSPPGNRLEALKGDRGGQHSVRINDQWRVCFVWRDGDAHDVEITDYH
ncbi:type II toxin-antitoxin system RelE/ParE family toxin [Roseomonas genomospecies 6]|uniref:Type II toxin-antitoxin system RelE/ParE family toxin n=1 Tax=Roseomonas genomospecies 6 TaxID=214106 RepID=A0A9W7NJC5_9PROT|nr:type II toxin-antitoxin system RelE/ParE family toxin [Roseomonas genomospecies 6]KAA0680378.1 type II toxin-antitoxin system RelE/ParE family toxin [Roseomonas genomospecies 6]